MKNSSTGWTLLLMANVVAISALGFLQPTTAQQPAAASLPDAAEAVLAELKGIHKELKAQTELLKSGKLQVVVAEKKK